MTKQDLVRKAKKLGINANIKWKEETIKKKIDEASNKHPASEPVKPEPVAPAPAPTSALEQAMALLINSNVETNKKLDTLITKLDNKETINDGGIDIEKQQIKYVKLYYAVQVTGTDEGTGRPLIGMAKSRNYKTFKEANLRGINNFGRGKYIVGTLQEPMSLK